MLANKSTRTDHLIQQFLHFCRSNQLKRQQQAVFLSACRMSNSKLRSWWDHDLKTKTRVSVTVTIITSLPPV